MQTYKVKMTNKSMFTDHVLTYQQLKLQLLTQESCAIAKMTDRALYK